MLRQYVDDIVIRTEGTYTTTTQDLTTASKVLLVGLHNADLMVPEKSTVASTNPEVAKEVQKQLAKCGQKVKTEKRVKDLGVDTSIGMTRAVGTAANRKAKAKVRQTRARMFGKGQGNELFAANIYPKSWYQGTITGMSPKDLKAVRAQTADMLGTTARGRCVDTIMMLEMGRQEPLMR